MLVTSWERQLFLYVDDFGRIFYFLFNDYIGDAGGLKRAFPDPPEGAKDAPGGLHHRYVQVRSVQPVNGKKAYVNIPVNDDNPLWTGNLGQIFRVGNYDCKTIKRVEEKEYGRAGAADERRQLKKHGINPYISKRE